MCSAVLQRIELKLVRMIGDRDPRVLGNFFEVSTLKVKGQPEVNMYLKNALRLPNYQKDSMNTTNKGHTGVSWGRPDANFLINAPWLPSKEPLTRAVIHYLVKFKGQADVS